MKKILLWLTVLVMCTLMFSVASLYGCGCKKVDALAAEEKVNPLALALEFAERAIGGETVEYTGTAGVTIGVVMPQLDNDGWFAIYIGALSKIIEMGADLVTLDARNSADTQLAMVEDLITKKVDAIVFVPVDSAVLSIGVIKANEAGIPVVLMDRSTEGGEVTALVESNNVAIGVKGAELMVEMAEKLGLKVEELKVLEIVGDLTTSAGQERHEGFSSKAAELGLNIVLEAPAYWDTAKANAAVLDAFQVHPEINAMYMASGCAYYSGVASALKSMGKLVPREQEGHILLISTDGCPEPLQAIRDGHVDADAAHYLVMLGSKAIEIAFNATKGKLPEEKIVRLDPDPITPDNVDDMVHWANKLEAARATK